MANEGLQPKEGAIGLSNDAESVGIAGHVVLTGNSDAVDGSAMVVPFFTLLMSTGKKVDKGLDTIITAFSLVPQNGVLILGHVRSTKVGGNSRPRGGAARPSDSLEVVPVTLLCDVPVRASKIDSIHGDLDAVRRQILIIATCRGKDRAQVLRHATDKGVILRYPLPVLVWRESRRGDVAVRQWVGVQPAAQGNGEADEGDGFPLRLEAEEGVDELLEGTEVLLTANGAVGGDVRHGCCEGLAESDGRQQPRAAVGGLINY